MELNLKDGVKSSLSGNASTATKLQTPRTISGVAFDGSANITLTASHVGAAASSHTHDDRYYTETEVNNKVSTVSASVTAHIGDKNNPHAVTKAQVGLGSCDNTADSNKNVKSAKYIVDSGTHAETASGTTANAPTTGMLYTSGMYMTKTYNDSNTPASYGNIINLAGNGTGQLLCEWSGSDNKTGSLYYRSHKDTSSGGWGTWNKILDSANYSSYTVTKTGSGASGTWGISITGNAATASASTKLQTARSIGGASFDGTRDIEIIKMKNAYGRTASADLAISADASLSMMLSTSSMTTGKPAGDGYILNFNWDNTGGWSNQLFIQNRTSGKLQYRGMDAGTWGSWNTVYSTCNKPTAADVGALTQSAADDRYMRQINANGYYGMTANGSTSNWVRTTSNGIIPYNSGGASSLGTSSWQFNTIYGKTIYENGASLSSKYATSGHEHTTVSRTDLTGTTTDLNSLTLSAGKPGVMLYQEKTTGGCASISNTPSSIKEPFVLDVEVIRWSSSTDYVTRQTLTFNTNKVTYQRFCTNGTWSSWTEKKYTDTNTWRGVQDNLTSTATDQSLSANQGKVLKALVDGKAASSHTHSYLPLSGGTLTGVTTFNNYLKLNAWSGYGSGTANFWYDGNNKFVEIQNATDLKLAGTKVSKEGHMHRRYCMVGSDSDATSGWYKVADYTHSGYGNTNITFLVTSTYAYYKVGIYTLQVRSDNSSISVKQNGWLTRNGFGEGDIKVVVSGMKYTVYVYQPSTRYGRIMFEILSESSIAGYNSGLNLYNTSTKESSTPSATSTSYDLGSLSLSGGTMSGQLVLANGGHALRGKGITTGNDQIVGIGSSEVYLGNPKTHSIIEGNMISHNVNGGSLQLKYESSKWKIFV